MDERTKNNSATFASVNAREVLFLEARKKRKINTNVAKV